jgi:hypothetical protein
MSEQITSHALILFTLLMLLHFSLYGVSSFTRAPSQRFRLLYFAIQALLIVLISLVAHRFTVTLGLYLALVGEIASLLLEIRMVLLVGAACLLLFSLNLHLLYDGEPVHILSPYPVPFYLALLYVLPAFVLVVVYALQQARARRPRNCCKNLNRHIANWRTTPFVSKNSPGPRNGSGWHANYMTRSPRD